MKSKTLLAALAIAAITSFGLGTLAPSPVQAEETGKKAKADSGKLVKLDQGNGKIEFVGAKVTGDHDGGFKKFTGKAVLGKDGGLKKLSFEVDTTSVWTDNERLTGHLKSPDFFDVARFPKATFQSSKIEKLEGEGGTHKVTGVMNLHGVIKKIAFPVTIENTSKTVNASTEFVINRFDWDIAYKGMADDLIKNEVLLKIQFEIPKK